MSYIIQLTDVEGCRAFVSAFPNELVTHDLQDARKFNSFGEGCLYFVGAKKRIGAALGLTEWQTQKLTAHFKRA